MNERLRRMAEAAHALQSQMNDGSIVRGVLREHKDDIMEQQYIQLLEGKDSDGNDLRPYYTEDLKPHGYFKSQQSASNYMAWKQSLAYPYTVSRTPNAPNLFINGRFYDELELRFEADTVGIFPASGYAADIIGKYGLQSFGLSALKWQVMFEQKGVRKEIQQRMKDILYDN